jgi:hypothetical protein
MPPPDHEWEFNLEEILSKEDLAKFLHVLAEQTVGGAIQFKALNVELPIQIPTTVRLERHGNRRRFLKIEIQLLSPPGELTSGLITDIFRNG